MNRPANCKAAIQASTRPGENFFVRAYEIEGSGATLKETLKTRRYLSLPSSPSTTTDSERIVPLNLSSQPSSTRVTEIRVSTGGQTGSFTLLTQCPVLDSDYAVSFQNGNFSPWVESTTGSTPAPLYAYVPYRAEALFIKNHSRTSTIRVDGMTTNASGAAVLDALAGPREDSVIPQAAGPVALIPRQVSWQGPGHSNVLWRFQFSDRRWRFAAGGFPLILSPSPAAVVKLKASTYFNGSHTFSHPFQQTFLRELKYQLSYFLGDTAALQGSLTTMLSGKNREKLMEFPNRFLLNPFYGLFSDLSYALSAQNTDRKSKWLGSSDGWQIRDPQGTAFAGNARIIPTTVYVSALGDDIKISTTSVARYTNRPIPNLVSVVKNGAVTTEPLTDGTRWDGMGVSAPITAPTPTPSAPAMDYGTSRDDGTAITALGAAALLDGNRHVPTFHNPFYGNKALIFRAVLAALTDLSALPESEIWRFSASNLNGIYAGGQVAFTAGRKVLSTYGQVGGFLRRVFCSSLDPTPTPDERERYNCDNPQTLPLSASERAAWRFTSDEISLLKKAFDVWTEGVHRLAYRLYPNNLVSSLNQSAHYLLGFQEMSYGSGDPFDEALAEEYAKRWVAKQSKAGWFNEELGPDASYIGMTNYHAGTFYLNSCLRGNCNQELKRSIAKTYAFFNHTVAPEPPPKRSILGGFNFNHRVGAGFHDEQFIGARGIALDIPEVSTWTTTLLGVTGRRPDRIPTSFPPPLSRLLNYDSPRYEGFSNLPEATPATLPALKSTSFTTDVHGAHELIAVKRPGYYTAIYVGSPVPTHFPDKIRSVNGENMRKAWPLDGEANGFQIDDVHNWAAPFVGGGMSLFWTPDFGNALLAGNWTPLVHHGLVAVDGRTGVRSWEDYFSTSYIRPTPTPTPNNNTAYGPTPTPTPNNYTTLTTYGELEPSPCTTDATTCSAISGYAYQRTYEFLPNSVVVTIRLLAEAGATAPAGSKIFENIPLAGGIEKTFASLEPTPPRPTPTPTPLTPRIDGGVIDTLGNGSLARLNNKEESPVNELQYYSRSSSVGLRIRFSPGTAKRVVTNGPKDGKGLQINRVELYLPIPAVPRPPAVGLPTEVKYCLQAISASRQECGF